MTRTFFYTLLILCICFHGLVKANLHPQPGQFGVQGELLYLQPCPPAFTFAAELVTFTLEEFTVKSLFNENKHKLGYRGEAVYACDCLNNLHGRFTYFESNHNPRDVDSTFIVPAQFTGHVHDNSQFRYYAVEALFGRWLFDCTFDLEIQAGILYSNIRFNEYTTVSGPTIGDAIIPPGDFIGGGPEDIADPDVPPNTRVIQSQFWGVGPELALNFQYPLPLRTYGIFAIAADARTALLIKKNKIFFASPDGFTQISDPVRGVIPSADLRLGLDWARCYRCVRLNLEAGYEWIFYHRAFGASNISFRGPYFVLGVVY